jgi:hypothetical protein
MAFNDPKLPRATLRGENLYVEGEKEPYFRDPEHTIWLRVDALTVYRGYERDHIKRTGKVLVESLRGIAKLEGRDRFAVVGFDETDRIEFHLRPVSDTETEFHWRANIGFRTHDWEWDLEQGFWIQGYCTRQYFDDLLAAVRRGHVDHIRVGMETTMWTKDKSSMADTPRVWHVAPPTKGESTQPALEHGNMLSLTWEEKFGLHPAKKTDDELTAPKPQVVELPARVYSMLSALVAIGAALLVLTFLRH